MRTHARYVVFRFKDHALAIVSISPNKLALIGASLNGHCHLDDGGMNQIQCYAVDPQMIARSGQNEENDMTHDEQNQAGDTKRPTEDLKNAARHEYDDARERLSGHAERLKTEGPSTIKTVVTDELDRRKAGIGAEIRSLAETLRSASNEQAEKAASGVGAAPSALLGQGADVLESLSSGLEGKSVDDLTQSVSTYARSNPAIFIGGCILAGLAVGRLLTASDHKNASPSTNSSNPYRPGQYDGPRRDDDMQPPAYQSQQESGYVAGQARDPGTEPPVFGTPGSTMREPSGASVADTSPEALRREDKHGL